MRDILSCYDIISFLSPIYFSYIVLCSLDTLAFSSFMLLMVLFIRSYSSYEIWFLMRSCCSRRWKLSYQPWVTCFSRQLSYGLMFMATSLISSNALENTLTFCSSTMEFMAATCRSEEDELWNSSSSLTRFATLSSMCCKISLYSESSRRRASMERVSWLGVPFIFIIVSKLLLCMTPILSIMMLELMGQELVFLPVRPELLVVVFRSSVLRRSELWL